MSKKSKITHKPEVNNLYRFGMGIEIVDNNILSGPDIERVVNRQMIGPESTITSNKSDDYTKS